MADNRTLADALPELIWTCDATGNLQWVNARWTELTGLTVEESLDKRALEVVHPEDLGVIATSWERALSTSMPCKFEYRIRSREGGYRWHLAHVTPVKEAGAITQWVAAAVDIHERRLTEDALRASERRFETAFSSNPYPMAVVRERDGALLQVNDAFTAVSGFAREEVLHRNGVELGMIPDRSRLGAAATGVDGLEIPFRTKLGATITMALTVTRIDFGGEPCVLAVGKDVTAQRAAEAALRSSEALARGRADELATVEAALREADRRKDEFLALLSHELRNPLAPIMMAAQVMELNNDEATARERAVILRQVSHMLRLVDDLLDVSRVTRGKVTLVTGPLAFAAPIRAAIEATAGLFENHQHQLLVEIEHGLAVDGDEVRITQIVSNLLTNAARYTPPNGRVSLIAAREGDFAVVRVRDNGAGMDARLLEHVFELFVQGEREPDRSSGGLGIGLSLVRALTELHGGTVTATSDGPGRGSELVVRIPALPPGTRIAAANPGVELPPTRAQRVLVVEDNEDGALMLVRVLETLGYTVRVFHDPEAALASVSEFAPQIAILDIGLPKMDGYTLGRELLARLSPPPALLALTGYGQEQDLRRSREAGFAHHLVKPLDVDKLRGVLDDVADSE